MDAFYASVEVRDRPELAGQPVVVGGPADGRGVVAAASYEARRFGIHSAMPSREAARRCPLAVFLAPRHDHYAEISRQIGEVFARYTPLVEPLSLDEAFLDVTASERLWGPAPQIGLRIKRGIRERIGLVASVGIAPNKFLAKLASDLSKPDGFVVVDPLAVQAFLDPLPVDRIFGVGGAGREHLARLGIRTIRQLRSCSSAELEDRFGQWGARIWALAHGQDDRPVVADRDAKSISHETTFDEDIADIGTLRSVLLELTEQVGRRLRSLDRRARTVSVKIRHGDFTTAVRSHTLAAPTDLTAELWHAARELLVSAVGERPPPLRLLGVGVTGLQDTDVYQHDLFDEQHRERLGTIDAIADRINERFGNNTVYRGNRRRPGSDKR